MLFSTLLLSAVALAAVSPLTPATGIQGQPCLIQWAKDNEGLWSNVTISLMSGSNLAMNVVTDIVSNIDGTSISSYSWTCPAVTPNSNIYFYQFVQNGIALPTWTTRFILGDTTGKFVPPQFATQPNGDAIPYGIGALAGNSASTSVPVSSVASTGIPPRATAIPATTSAVVAPVVTAPVSTVSVIRSTSSFGNLPTSASSSTSSSTASTSTSTTVNSSPSVVPATVRTAGAQQVSIGAGLIFTALLML